MLLIIERLTGAHHVNIQPSRFENYLTALREVNSRLGAEELSLNLACEK